MYGTHTTFFTARGKQCLKIMFTISSAVVLEIKVSNKHMSILICYIVHMLVLRAWAWANTPRFDSHRRRAYFSACPV